MSEPLISVIVPMYNARPFIRKCMEHLVHQTYKKLEIIIIDDGSTDGCGEIIQEYANQDKRVKLVTQKNAGVSSASNTGLKAAHGEYVHIHDHDDFVNLDYFEKMANAAVLTNADVLCGEVNQPDYNFPVFDAIEICVSLEDKIRKTRANRFNPAWRYVYKTAFLRKNNLLFEPSVLGAQDKLFSKPAIILADTVATVPDAKYNVVNTPTALGKNKQKIKRSISAETAKAFQRYHDFLEKHHATKLIGEQETPYHQNKYQICNRTFFRTDIYTKKKKYYLFGINICTKHLY